MLAVIDLATVDFARHPVPRHRIAIRPRLSGRTRRSPGSGQLYVPGWNAATWCPPVG